MSKEKEVAYCGLYCGDCVIRKGKLASLSKQLIESMQTADFQKLACGLPDIFPDIVSDLPIVKLENVARADLLKDAGYVMR